MVKWAVKILERIFSRTKVCTLRISLPFTFRLFKKAFWHLSSTSFSALAQLLWKNTVITVLQQNLMPPKRNWQMFWWLLFILLTGQLLDWMIFSLKCTLWSQSITESPESQFTCKSDFSSAAHNVTLGLLQRTLRPKGCCSWLEKSLRCTSCKWYGSNRHFRDPDF